MHSGNQAMTHHYQDFQNRTLNETFKKNLPFLNIAAAIQLYQQPSYCLKRASI